MNIFPFSRAHGALGSHRCGGWLALLVMLAGGRAAHAATYSVDTFADTSLSACTAAPNDCSLRGAITNANGTADNDDITFDASVFTPPRKTITL